MGEVSGLLRMMLLLQWSRQTGARWHQLLGVTTELTTELTTDWTLPDSASCLVPEVLVASLSFGLRPNLFGIHKFEFDQALLSAGHWTRWSWVNNIKNSNVKIIRRQFVLIWGGYTVARYQDYYLLDLGQNIYPWETQYCWLAFTIMFLHQMVINLAKKMLWACGHGNMRHEAVRPDWDRGQWRDGEIIANLWVRWLDTSHHRVNDCQL